MRFTLTTRVVIAVVLLASVGCGRKKDEPGARPPTVQPPAAATLDRAALVGVFQPLPARFDSATNPITDEKIALGRMLYFDKRLSKNQDVACASCHDLASYGVDGHQVSEGHRKQKGVRNAPTVYNAAGHTIVRVVGVARRRASSTNSAA
jgi:cytochrome c peroxidase